MVKKENTADIEAIKDKYYSDDHFPNHLGIKIVALSLGSSIMEMEVSKEMTNFHGIAHGGALFTLADTAFGLASNSRGPAVALQVSINFMAMTTPGQRLTASAKEVTLTGSTGIYDISVENEKNEVVALFRGVVYRLKKAGGKGS